MTLPSDSLNNNENLSTPCGVRSWLAAKHPKELALLDQFETELRLGRLSTSSTASAKAVDSNPNAAYEAVSKNYGGISGRDRRLVTFRTVDLLRSLIGTTKWKNAAQLMTLLRGLGRELHASGGSREPAIGNIVRRIMCAVRQEVANSEGQDNENGNGSGNNVIPSSSNDDANMDPIDEDLAQNFNDKVNLGTSITGFNRGGGGMSKDLTASLVDLLWANPQQLTNPNRRKGQNTRRKDSFSSVDSDPLDHMTSNEDFPSSYYVTKQHFRPAIMEVIQEFMSDLEDLHKNINDQAASHIHAGEVVLTYGRSKTVESVSFCFFVHFVPNQLNSFSHETFICVIKNINLCLDFSF
jgi:translation initiation factor 2B subunit (eIF-2B alpha/beta/delta family)